MIFTMFFVQYLRKLWLDVKMTYAEENQII